MKKLLAILLLIIICSTIIFFLSNTSSDLSRQQSLEANWVLFNAENLDKNDNFGRSVAIEGDWIAVGAVNDDGAENQGQDRGSVYLYKLVNNQPILQTIIGDGHQTHVPLDDDDYFGISVAIGEEYLLVGARGDDGEGVSLPNPDHHGAKGAVYVFDLSSNELIATIGDGYDVHVPLENDAFGWDIDIEGDKLAVAAVFDDGAQNQRYDTGAVYLYNIGQDITDLKLDRIFGDGYEAHVPLDDEDAFAHAVHIDGNTLLIGADKDDGRHNQGTNYGALYKFDLDSNHYTIMGNEYEHHIPLDDSDFFGLVAEVDGACLISGASGDDGYDDSVSGRGAVHVLDKNSLRPLGKIGAGYDINLPLKRFDYASYFVAMDQDILLSGAPYGEQDGRPDDDDSGEVYMIRNACRYLQNHK